MGRPWEKTPPESGNAAPSQEDEMRARVNAGLTVPVKVGRHAWTAAEFDDVARPPLMVVPDADELAEAETEAGAWRLAYMGRAAAAVPSDPDAERTINEWFATAPPSRRFRLPAWTTPAVAWAWAIAAIVIAARVTVPSQGVTLGMGIAVGAACGVLPIPAVARRYARRLRAEGVRLHAALTRGERS